MVHTEAGLGDRLQSILVDPPPAHFAAPVLASLQLLQSRFHVLQPPAKVLVEPLLLLRLEGLGAEVGGVLVHFRQLSALTGGSLVDHLLAV
jgi:hypothetical protein